MKNKTVVDVDYCASVQIEIQTSVSVKLDGNDVINWLNLCCDPTLLKYIGKYAIRSANIIENVEDDDFRSRA